jgi:hypothetical protein
VYSSCAKVEATCAAVEKMRGKVSMAEFFEVSSSSAETFAVRMRPISSSTIRMACAVVALFDWNEARNVPG